jgi:hypothetical protein
MSDNQTVSKPKISWQTRRIAAMNRIINRKGNARVFAEHYADEHLRVCQSQCKTKKEYKIWTRTNGRV